MNNDRITALEQHLAAIQAEIEKLKAEEQSKEVKPWSADEDERYYAIDATGEILELAGDSGKGCDEMFSRGNYYQTRELAEQDAKELALRGRVRQLRDALCEGYQFKLNDINFCVFFDTAKKYFHPAMYEYEKYVGAIYFDTFEHAQTVCDILNAEMRKESGGNG